MGSVAVNDDGFMEDRVISQTFDLVSTYRISRHYSLTLPAELPPRAVNH